MQKLLDAETEKNVQTWLAGDYDAETKQAIEAMSAEELTDAFYRQLEFGTGGLRGIMGVGCNRMNIYTVRAATQGLANYIRKVVQGEPAVLISYDSRHHSRTFAQESARVLAANGIKAYIFKTLHPTPLASFGCRHLRCAAAVMVTASHNPREYNGYKVYWSHGGQVLPPHDQGIIAEVEQITSPDDVREAPLDDPLIEWVGEEVDRAYLEAIAPCAALPDQNRSHGSQLRIVYTSLHGTGEPLTLAALRDWGFTDLHPVEKQCIPDGDFPTLDKPNPEEHAAMKLGIDQLKGVEGDILLGSDPDADRLGVAVRHGSEVTLLNGNQIASLCLDHLLTHGKLPPSPAAIKTIVTTELFAAICKSHDVTCFNVLTGFKYIGQLMEAWARDGGHSFVFGAEESYGYLVGTHARDKDAVVCAALVSEIALDAKRKGETLLDRLNGLYERHGVYREGLRALTFEGKAGAERMNSLMEGLRSSPPSHFADIAVHTVEDYKRASATDMGTGKERPLTLPRSNVLLYWLADGSRLVVRPSGTEPKIKLYGGVVDKELSVADKKLDSLLDALQAHLQ